MSCKPCQENKRREEERLAKKSTTKSEPYTAVDAIKDVVTGNAQWAPEEVQLSRTAICVGCDKYNTAFKACNVCKCIVKTKVRFSRSSCPEGKWVEHNG